MHGVIAKPSQTDFALDLAGFGLGLGLAFYLHWDTTDLVWGLWLSSLVIGYASILLGIARARVEGRDPLSPTLLATKLFMVAFFTVHFGMFHFVHSVFLNLFFPVVPESGTGFGPGLAGYAEVLVRYWPWLIAAAIAERRGLLPGQAPVAAATARRSALPGFNPMQPYKNVVRMHLLIFFFAGTAAVGLHGFVIYAVVFAVYFWPWRGMGRLDGTRAPAAE